MSAETLEEIVKSLDLLANNPAADSWSDGEWTTQIKIQCQRLADKRRCKIYASSLPNADGGEWLFDVCLMRFSDEHGIEQLALALESEWIQKAWEIDNDFLKLVVSRADARVMIFQAATTDKAKENFDRLRHLAKSFPASLKGDQYLLSCWVAKKRGFEHERFMLQAT